VSNDLYLKQIRNLCLWLFLSGFLNILLISALLFWFFQDPFVEEWKPPAIEERLQVGQLHPTNAAALGYYKSQGFEKLFLALKKTGLIEDGYRERDLALGVLVSFHDFDLERALKSHFRSLEKRILSFKEGNQTLLVYPGITDLQYQAIYEFAQKEKWPFKIKGLISLLKKEQFKDEPSLHDAIFLTPEFATVEALFKGINVSRQHLIRMLREGNFGLLLAFLEKSGKNQASESRQKLLLAYLNEGSSTAGQLLLKTDFEFAAKRLGDPAVLSMVQNLDQNTKEATSFLAILLASSRGETVKSEAKAKYLELTGKSWEPLVSRVSRETSLLEVEKVVTFPSKPKKELLYIVQDGDSLWKIAKRFSVKIEEIRELNKLKSDFLKPGTPLRVPDRALQDAKGGISKVS
jgi:LysM repeat protein